MLANLLNFDTASFMPHGHCYLWTPWLLWTYVISDGLITLAYYSIPLALQLFVRQRKDLEFSWVFVLFSIFIFACGTTHLMSIWTIWNPSYPLDAMVKAVTAAASILTAILLWPLVPKALALPSPSQLQRALKEREREINQRRLTEDALAAANETLEQRVAERTAALQQAEQRLTALLSIERDRRLEAERVSRMKEEFLLTLSHELRTPLNAIFGWTQILKRRNDAATVGNAVEVIDRNVRTQTKLIEDLLDVSAIMAGKLRLEVQSVDLAEIIHLVAASIKPEAVFFEIRLETVISTPVFVHGDAGRLQQVIWNLLSNALKFTPRGGKIDITLTQSGSRAEIRITDTGQGIPADFLPLLFARFSQADSSSRRRYGGIGLGLSIVKSLVEAHAGSVQAESPGADQGATFKVSLPVLMREQDGAQEQTPSGGTAVSSWTDDPPSLRGISVLVVDDEADSRHLARTILEDQGARVTTAASAAEGREFMAADAPDVLVCDIGMPVEDGYDFIMDLRRRGLKMPAIALTAYARAEDRVKAFRAGFDHHLSKPVEPTELLASITRLAGRHESAKSPSRPGSTA